MEKQLPLTSLGVMRNDETGQWGVVKIPFNPLTKEVGSIEFIPEGSTREEALERFKVLSIQLGVIE